MADTIRKLDDEQIIDRLWDSESSKHNREEFTIRFEKLLSGARENDLYDLFLLLFKQFDFYTKTDVNTYLKNLYSKLSEELNPVDCLFTFIKRKDGGINSSYDYAMEFKFLNKIPSRQYAVDLNEMAEYWEFINNIVLIDDCCGTGGTLKDFVENSGLDFSNKSLYYLVIHKMQESDSIIQSLERNFSSFQIKCIAVNTKEKIFNLSEAAPFKDKFRSFSKGKGVNDDLIFGYESSESVFAFYNNTPNNTLGIFHVFSKNKNLPLFPRESKTQNKPGWVTAKEDKERRTKMLVNNSKRDC